MEALLFSTLIVLMLCCASISEEVCDRRPLGTKTEPLRPDNQFVLEIDQIKDNKYIPGKTYVVRLRSRDKNATFIAFTISLKEDTMYNVNNPRKPVSLNPGRLEPNSTNAKLSTVCNHTIVESDITAKNKVEVLWTAPGKDNKCVSIFAVVAVRPNLWYSFEKPLSQKVCEDPRKSDDMQPKEIDGDCNVCEDARYQLTFEGLWSYNTHPTMFPQSKELARFSDVVGASHSPSTSIFKFSSEASMGIQMLAEQGNTTKFEIEIQNQLPKYVRTVIKATSPEQTDMSTVTSFKATREHHRLTIATGILPSPDWFLGVSSLELCTENSTWADHIRLNLYPIDAGTDKGLSFESSNEEQLPPLPISLAVIGKAQKEKTKPFARLLLTLMRTYATPDCATDRTVTEKQEGDDDEDNDGDEEVDQTNDSEEPTGGNERDNAKAYRPAYTPRITTTTSEEPPAVDPDSPGKCPMTNWDEWQTCEGMCLNGTLTGLQIRFRYHIVDGVTITDTEKYGYLVPQFCLDNFSDMESQACEDTCTEEGEIEEEEEAAEAARRTWPYYTGRK